MPLYEVTEDGLASHTAATFAALGMYERADLQPHRWFTDHPFVDEAKQVTWVLTSQWGRNTEGALRMLADAFPAAGVTYRAAED